MGSVRTIYDAMVSEIADELGSEWQQLQRWLTAVEQNTSRNILKGYGVIPGSVNRAPGVTRAITLDQNFQVVLTDQNSREITDEKRVTQLLDVLYDAADSIHDRLMNKQLGIPGVVTTVRFPSINDPEYLDSFIVLRMGVVVNYRRQLPT